MIYDFGFYEVDTAVMKGHRAHGGSPTRENPARNGSFLDEVQL